MTVQKSRKLSKLNCDAEPLVAPGQPARIVRDFVPGFFLMVGSRGKSFAFQRDVRDAKGERRTIRRSLGRFTGDERGVTVESARQAAMELIAHPELLLPLQPADVAQGGPKAMTLADAITLFNATAAKGRRGQPRAPKTERRYKQYLESGYLASWMELPLASISRAEVFRHHQMLAREIVAGKYAGLKRDRRRPKEQDGKVTADDVFRWFRAIYNRAMRQDATLPVNPCINVEWFAKKRDRTAIPSFQLRAWHEGVEAIANPIRRDYLLFALLTGLRVGGEATGAR
jgi:hypothetical protein